MGLTEGYSAGTPIKPRKGAPLGSRNAAKRILGLDYSLETYDQIAEFLKKIAQLTVEGAISARTTGAVNNTIKTLLELKPLQAQEAQRKKAEEGYRDFKLPSEHWRDEIEEDDEDQGQEASNSDSGTETSNSKDAGNNKTSI